MPVRHGPVRLARQRLVQMNPRAKIGEASHGQAGIDDMLDGLAQCVAASR